MVQNDTVYVVIEDAYDPFLDIHYTNVDKVFSSIDSAREWILSKEPAGYWDDASITLDGKMTTYKHIDGRSAHCCIIHQLTIDD